MRLLIAAVTAGLLASGSAAAQTIPAGSACAAFTPAPALADGARASREAMTAAEQQLEAWRAMRDQELAACQTEIAALRAQLEAMIGAYNAAGEQRVAAIRTWNGEVAQFSARGGRRASSQN